MFGLELVDFELESDQAIERPVEEEQVEGEIPPADLERVLAADKQKSRPSSMRNCFSCSTSPCCRSASE